MLVTRAFLSRPIKAEENYMGHSQFDAVIRKRAACKMVSHRVV